MNSIIQKNQNTFNDKLARAFVEQKTMFLQDKYYTDGKNLFLKTSATISFPVNFEDDYISIDYYFDPNNDYSFEIDENLWRGYLESKQYSYADITRAWLEAEGEELDDDGDIPSWVDEKFCSDIINFARGIKVFAEIIEEIEEEHHDNCVAFAYGSILNKPYNYV